MPTSRYSRGGVKAWEAAGFPIYSGVHVPSKAFAEVVEHEYATPWISAGELAQRQQSTEKGSPFSTAARTKNTIRTAFRVAVSVPGAELVYRFQELVAFARHLCRRQLRRAYPQHHRRPGAD